MHTRAELKEVVYGEFVKSLQKPMFSKALVETFFSPPSKAYTVLYRSADMIYDLMKSAIGHHLDKAIAPGVKDDADISGHLKGIDPQKLFETYLVSNVLGNTGDVAHQWRYILASYYHNDEPAKQRIEAIKGEQQAGAWKERARPQGNRRYTPALTTVKEEESGILPDTEKTTRYSDDVLKQKQEKQEKKVTFNL